MRTPVEVESRGPLTKDRYLKLMKFFKAKAVFLEKKERVSFLYYRSRIPKHVRSDREEKVDLRLRVTNGKAELVMKHGTWGGSDLRKEYTFPVDVGKTADMIEFLAHLGWHICVILTTRTHAFRYGGVEWALVEQQDNRHYWEAEILAKDTPHHINQARARVKTLVAKMGLSPYSQEGFERECDKVNHTPGHQCDFLRDDPRKVLDRFKSYLR